MPLGVIVVSEVWNVFAQEKISLCNGAINGIKFNNEIIKFPVLLYDTTPLRHRSGAFSVFFERVPNCSVTITHSILATSLIFYLKIQ